MKTKHILFFALLLTCLLIWLFRPASKGPIDSQEPGKSGQKLSPNIGSPDIKAEESKRAKIQSSQRETSVPSSEDRLKQRAITEEHAFDEWRTPINFYGKVVDEEDKPIGNVLISLGWTDLSPTDGYSRAQTVSDSDGKFSLQNKTGKHLTVKISKENYYVSKANRNSFSYAGENVNFVPDSNSPVIFRLRKKGNAEPLITFENDFLISKDGKPVSVSLSTGKSGPASEEDLRVECWADDQGKKKGEKYDWKCRITVPNGGLVLQSTNEFDFEAPLEGYQVSDEIGMPTSLENGWQRNAERNYFLKLGNGNYARIKFKMISGGGHFFHIESFINPSGSRNLEYDPAVQPKQKEFY